MSLSAAMLEIMRDKGLSIDDAIELAAMWEAGNTRKRTPNAERQARHRAKKAAEQAESVTHNVTCNAESNVTEPFLSPSSPTPPPSTILSSKPPIVPHGSAKTRRSKASSTSDLAEQVWQAASSVSRGRSGRDKVRPAVAAAVSAGATPEALLASVRTTCREAGQFAKGLHQIVNGEHWRDYGPSPPSQGPAAAVSPEVHQQRIRHLKETNEWRESWGPRPERSAA